MLIKRNVYFSAIDENGEEKLYSTNEVINEEDYLEMLFSDKEDDEDKDEKKSDKNIAEKVGKGAMVAGSVGTAGSISVPIVKAGARPFKEAFPMLPGAMKARIKKKLGMKLTDKDRKKLDNLAAWLEKAEERAVFQDPATYSRRAGKAISNGIDKNAKRGLAVTAAGAGLYAVGKLAKKKKGKEKED